MSDDKFPRITLEDDEPIVTFDRVVGWIVNALAGVGLAATLMVIGYWSIK